MIVQAFSIHINVNSGKLCNKFVSFKGRKEIIVEYDDNKKIECINKEIFEDFSIKIKMEKHLKKEILKTLIPNFSTNR